VSRDEFASVLRILDISGVKFINCDIINVSVHAESPLSSVVHDNNTNNNNNASNTHTSASEIRLPSEREDAIRLMTIEAFK
jgi:hypothetical protein